MKPMGLNSTHFLSYHEIKFRNIDLFEDAFGLNTEFSDVIDVLRKLKSSPDKQLTRRLIEKIRKAG
jgi:hypothetical protein